MCCRTLVVLVVLGVVAQVNAECTYQGVVFAAGSTVPVSEPCLRCLCARSGLLCQLRVCAELPDPPPPGCVAVHRRKACCPQLLCHDEPVNNNRIEARLEPDFPEIPYNQSMVGNGCVHGGTLYGPGSAMHTSTRCSHCYCIAGQQRCVRPRCLLPAHGCAPVFRPHACCPTSYKCRASNASTPATLHQEHDPDSCLVSGVRVPAGARATGAARSPCDACYCVRGAVRCTPLRCAPALPGCTPLVPAGACCPTSYNCSGTIEVQPLRNYDKPPDVSPDYAKLRTGAHPPSNSSPVHSPDTKHPHYIVADSHYHAPHHKTSTPYYFTSTAEPGSANFIPTSRQYVATTKHLPLNEFANPENSGKYSRISLTTTRVANGEKDKKITTEAASVVLSPVYNPNLENTLPKNFKYSNYVDADFTSDDMYLDGRNNRRIDDQIELTETSTVDTTTETDVTTTETTTEFSTTTDVSTDVSTLDSTTFETTTNSPETPTNTKPIVKLIGNNSECIDGPIENIEEKTINSAQFEASTDELTTTTTEQTTLATTTVDNVEVSSETDASNLSATSVPFKKLPANVETVKKDEDYEYDYNLQPNLEIIPFVAADAVVEAGGGGTAFPPLQDALRETDDPLFPPYNLNLFSPPQETEGGFVPRDPPQLYGAYHDAPGVDRADIADCAVFGREVHHGALAPAPPACERCLCLFGAVVCHPPTCNEGAEAPTLVQDTGPFRDVIRTEPAPGLHELIGDLQQHQQHIPSTSTTTTSERTHQQTENKQVEEDGDSFYDTLYQLLGGEQVNATTSTTTTTTTMATTKYKTTNTPWTPPSPPPPTGNAIEETSTALGLLKLAGCNIYGRMYRVGKIIAELSGPCLQCRCTDTGVQCTSLPC